MRGIPKNIDSIKRKIKKYIILNPKKKKKHFDFNRTYKNVEWKESFTVRECIGILKSKEFHCFLWLKKNDRMKKANDGGVSAKSLESELFKREVAFLVENAYWSRNSKAKKNYRMKYRGSTKFTIEINGTKHLLGKLPKDIKEKGERIKAYLRKNLYIFDKKSPYHLSDVNIRKMLRENLFYGSIETFDILSYIRDLKLSQK